MDQLSAHLDRGWDLLMRGDPHGAELSARRALELDSQSPEVYNLLGYVAALQGEYDTAIEHYHHAISLDETYFEAMLNAAEILIHPFGDFAAAIDMCETALDLAQTNDEAVDAMLLKFDALIGMEHHEEARQLATRFPRGPYENPMHSFLVGRALYEAGEPGRARPLIEAALHDDPSNAEAHYYDAVLKDDRGDVSGATRAFLRARALDLRSPHVAWSLTQETFEATVQTALGKLSESAQQMISQDNVFVADVPGVEAIMDGVDPRALVLVDPLNRPGEGEPNARVIVYQRNIERVAGALENVEAEIVSTLERELTMTFPSSAPEAPQTLN